MDGFTDGNGTWEASPVETVEELEKEYVSSLNGNWNSENTICLEIKILPEELRQL